MGTAPKVFISYTRLAAAEAALARTIADRLEQNGCAVFIDLDIKLGRDWNEEIERALDACDVFCVLLSATSVARPMVQQEVEWIGQRRLRENNWPELWPIRCNFEGKLPYDLGAHLRRAQYLAWEGEADTAYVLDQLFDRLRELRNEPPQSSQSANSPPIIEVQVGPRMPRKLIVRIDPNLIESSEGAIIVVTGGPHVSG